MFGGLSRPAWSLRFPDASPALLQLLSAARGPLQPPIRSEIFGPQRFAEHGRSLGQTHRAARAPRSATVFHPRLRSNIATLREAYQYIGLQAATGYDVSPAAEWLLDNFHLIEAQLKEIHEGLPRSYFRGLPVLQDEPLAGLPRIYGVAWAFVAHTDGAFDEDLLAQFLGAYQEARELTLSELWALPTTLRVVLIDNLRRLAERVATNKAARELANRCCDRIDDWTPEQLDALRLAMQARGVDRVLLTQMAQRLRNDHSPNRAEALAWLHSQLPDLASAQTQQGADQTADNLSVSNAVTSLRAIGDADWLDIVARSSVLMQTMLGSPVFAAEHAQTRDQTLHAIERLARRAGRSEVAVAQTLIALMPAAPDATAGLADAEPAGLETRRTLPTHWLQGPGRPALMQALGLNDGLARIGLWLKRRALLPAYLAGLALGSAALVAWGLPPAATLAGWPAWQQALVMGLMLLPASEVVVALINRMISESVHPQALPRLALARGIPPSQRVLVAIPALLGSDALIDSLVHRLLLHHLANPEPEAQFALLSDWPDADGPQAVADQHQLDRARLGIEALNARHPPTLDACGQRPAPRFVLLHRVRRFSVSEQRWIGWERKRGKLAGLIDALASGQSGVFLDLGETSRLATGVQHVLTLDSDTQLPPGRLRELVGVAAHPHNQPQLDASGRQVRAGHGILQPRLVTPLPAPAELTPFHRLFAGQSGIDPYSAASSEIYQDLFGAGSFTGKGLLNVGALQAVLKGLLPEGRVLSHDLLEGALARCATVSDVTLIEEAPFHADVAAARVHRWTRGDWQLLPFLLRAARYHLSGINCWKLFDNLRRSLVPPLAMAWLLLALAGHAGSPWVALAVVLAAFSAGPLLGALAGLLPGREHLARRRFYQQACGDLLRAALGGVWHLAQLLQESLMAVDAITRALYRLLISHRHLLQWTTAAAAQASARTALPAVLNQHRTEPVVAGILLALLLLAGTPHGLLAGALCLLWAGSPLWTWWASRPPRARPEQALPAAELAYLGALARDTWAWFERCVTAEDLHLPPDNLQTLPNEMLAHRTSPTNIGLYLLSAACAQAFGWISPAELAQRLENTLATMQRLARHRGHFYNWYDTQTGQPLLPCYVSTVDSGNLSGHLLAVAQACRALAAPTAATPPEPEGLAERLLALAEVFEALAWQPQFGFLYHRKRHLLHIGYRVAEQQLDASFYDLLASESRLTSLLAIAKGDVPVRHWSALGRPFFAVGTAAGLRSWSGSMFEYLMPSLVLAEPPGSVLWEANCSAVREQRAYAASQKRPWGISESAYAGRDHTLAYQYSPQGVPRLALRRTPRDELVVAPYATALALLVAPTAACANLHALQALGARGTYGFIEALDYTPARQTGSEPVTPVATFMAHHQGMSLVALANLLLDGVAQRWGMAHPAVEAVASLLHERAPREVSRLHALPAGPTAPAAPRQAPGLLRQIDPGATALPPTHLLSNGRYSVSLRPNGAGWSRRDAVDISRWRDDALRDAQGSFFYLRRHPGQGLASLTQHPAPAPSAHYRSSFHADRVCFDSDWPDLQARITVWVSPEDDIEFRQVELLNLGDEPLTLELISAFEPSLSEARADESHPAFTNLFVRAAWLATQQALWLERTPRLPSEPALKAAHFLAQGDPQVTGLRQQADRQAWRGRNRAASQPLACFDDLPLADPDLEAEEPALVTGLDPICALSVSLRIAPQGKARLTFATAASDHAGTLRAVIDKYRQASHIERASLMSATLAGIRLRDQRLGAEAVAAVQSLSTALVLSLTRPASPGRPTAALATQGGPAAPPCDRRLLWSLGISGDRPLLLVQAGVPQGLSLLRTLGQALRQWDWARVPCDLVVVNAEPASYQPLLQRELSAMAERHRADKDPGAPPACTAWHVLRAEDLSPALQATLSAWARVEITADGRPLAHHVQAWSDRHEADLEDRHATATTPLRAALAGIVTVPAPQGRFDAESGEFRFDVSALLRPTRPWINVLANPQFGAQISEAGGGYTWAGNSRMNQLTAWSNDAVADPPAESFLLQDLHSREVWSLSPSAWVDGQAVYRVVHGQGYSAFSHHRGLLEVSAVWCVDPVTAVKQVQLRLLNRGHRSLHLRVAGVVEWLMGAQRSDRQTVLTQRQRLQLAAPQGEASAGPALNLLLATQPEASGGFGGGTAFLALAGPADEDSDWTCDRRECFDARGHPVLPDHLGQRSGAGLDPCAALSRRLSLAGGQSAECVFLLGHAESPDAARQLALQAATVPPTHRLEAARQHWDDLLGATQVSTPDPLFDALVNRWLLYQTVSCRLWAKAGFYQAGGATGFRDQLQDAMALAWARPALLREQILRCAARQFVEGDVQHWWHAPGGAGVRTHFSDDLLWLAHACLHHVRCTGDLALLDEQVPFLQGGAIPPGAEDLYETPQTSPEQASVFEHAARALDRSLAVGQHGLPLMGSGDWNDGMNRVGIEGRGESVWLGWFLCRLVGQMAPLARSRGEAERAARWEQAAEGWQAALRGPAWDGEWFKRAFFDDGSALGSQANSEARIDLIAQAWAVLSGVAPLGMQQLAMASVRRLLLDRELGLIKLLDPPLAEARPSAGYIQAYPPGVRENGGQYAHAGVWALMAEAELTRRLAPAERDNDLAWRHFTWLSPAHRAAHPGRGPLYGLEPYVMAGDVYTQPPYAGRGGWSWYTGAAAWMHRAAIESILGLQQSAQSLRFMPALPSHWPQAELSLRRDGRHLHFLLLRGSSLASVQALAPAGLPLLWPGEDLHWEGTLPDGRYLIPLLDKPSAAPLPDSGRQMNGSGA